jgi:hypothetical protein
MSQGSAWGGGGHKRRREGAGRAYRGTEGEGGTQGAQKT